jgi:threonine dehydrogenase-like Zn-dependent dehydrogenase
VHGRGIVSRLIREILSVQLVLPADQDSRPAAIVDATGDPARLVELTRRLADLGTLVLVGEPLGRSLDMQLYPDVHVRGLRLVGVPAPRFGQHGEAGTDLDESLLDLMETTLCHTTPETALPDASWYAVHFSDAPDSMAER